MIFTPNLKPAARVLYVVAGIALVVVPFAVGMEGWARVVAPLLGGVSATAKGVPTSLALHTPSAKVH